MLWPTTERKAEIFKIVHDLSGLIASLRNPLGTAENPGRTCQDLRRCEPTVSDGTYWIDPNLGCSSDAIKVVCNFTAGAATCLKPVTVSKLEMGVGKVQMTFLHLLSTEALQHVIVHCLNVAVWGADASRTPSRKALRFKAWNGQVIQPAGTTGPRVLEDSCWMRDNRWHRTHFVFHSQDSSLLPIVDMYNLPITGPGSYFHVEVGPVCFL